MTLSATELALARDVAKFLITTLRTANGVSHQNAMNKAIMDSLPEDTTDAERWDIQQRLLQPMSHAPD